MAIQTCRTRFVIGGDMESADVVELGTGRVAVCSFRCPGRDGPNQDAAALIGISESHCVLVVADGFGGHPAGAQAAEIAVRKIEHFVCTHAHSGETLRSVILDGFERADEAVREMGVGAATTLAVADIEGNQFRCYHVGDSAILVTGQRGLIKLRSVAHSPVGYAVESGLIDEEEAMNHEERHVVSNMVGSAEMRIEIGPNLVLARHDTVVLASDGLWDNMLFDDIVEHVRKGPIDRSVTALVGKCRERMVRPEPGVPSKPDDLTVVAYRPRRAR